MDKTFWEKRRDEIQGRYNLEMGIHLAAEDFFNKYERYADDDSLPTMAPENVEKLFAVINQELERMQKGKHRKSLFNKVKTIVKHTTPVIAFCLIMAAGVFAATNSRQDIPKFYSKTC